MADSNTTPEDRVRIFDRRGSPLAEFRAAVDRSWVVGEESRAQFTYASRKTDIVRDTIFRSGNYLLVENSLLPPWVGVIDMPQNWGVRQVTVSAYSPERVMAWRYGPIEWKFNNPAGVIFETLIWLVNNAEPTPIQAGNLWRGGTPIEVTLTPTKLSESLLDVYERSGEEYAWRPVTDAFGHLAVYADWFASLGAQTGVLLHEGKGGGNVESVQTIYTEDTDIVNEVFAYGDGATWASKPMYTIRDEESIAKFGLRQMSVEFQGVTSADVLRENASRFLDAHKLTPRLFRMNALNISDTFKYVGLGNVFSLHLENAGFSGGTLGFQTDARVTAMRYNPTTKNKIELALQEVV